MAESSLRRSESLLWQQWLHEATAFLTRPRAVLQGYRLQSLRPDLIAGLTVAVVMLPQAIAYALVAELPPQMGLYAAVVAAIAGILWGSSRYLHTGPTNAASLLVLSTLAGIAAPGSPEYLAAAGLLAVMVGVARLVMGLAHLGVLVHFVSDSVIVGFTAGAGVLISVNQLPHLLRLEMESSPRLLATLGGLAANLEASHLPSLSLGLLAAALIGLIRWRRPGWPAALIGMAVAALLVAALNLQASGVIVLGELPRSLPPLARLPWLDVELIGRLSTGALAIAVVGLVEALSIARTIAAHSGEHLDSNQEFVGQGMANIAAGLFSGYPTSGSFTRSALNYEAGARSPLAAVFSGLFVLLAALLFAPLAAYLPRAALAGLLVVIAYQMIDRREIARIWRTSRGDTTIMAGTFLGTLLLPLEFAVVAGVLISFGRYIAKTSAPAVQPVLPDERFEHFVVQPPERPLCPQLEVLTIEGSLYFGACHHVEEAIRHHMEAHPEQKYLLLRMHRVNLVDISGLHMLETVVRLYRERGGDLYMVGVRSGVWEKMQGSGFDRLLGIDHFLSQERAIEYLFYRVLDPALCIYRCRVKVWKECQSLPKSETAGHIPLGTLAPPPAAAIPAIAPQALWQQLNEGAAPLLVDVREPGEFCQGHIANARLHPMPQLLSQEVTLPRDEPAILVCRTGRRTKQVIYALQREGYEQLAHLSGGMMAWEAAGLPVIIE
jgi:sulfate permease, SulP family